MTPARSAPRRVASLSFDVDPFPARWLPAHRLRRVVARQHDRHRRTGPAAPPDDPINEARDALRKRDAKRLATLRNATRADKHPLAQWVDYWELGNRISEASTDEVEAFYQRWSGSYVEDRMRNDWLLELGRRRDWVAFVRDYPRFRMNDDREVSCYWLLTEHIAGKRVYESARALWFAQRDTDDGCTLMASTLVESKVFRADDSWMKLRLSVEANRPRVARAVAPLIDKQVATEVGELLDNPVRYLRRRSGPPTAQQNELALLAIIRTATSDPDAAAGLMDERWHTALGAERAAWAWAVIGKQAAIRLSMEAPQYYKRALALAERPAARRAVDRRHAGLGGAQRAARRTQRRSLADGAARHRLDERARAGRTHLDLLEGAGAGRHGRRRRRRRRPA